MFLRGLPRLDADATPTWDLLAWLRYQWDAPLARGQGILQPDDARRTFDIGADAVSVYNHGGNDLNGVIPWIAALSAVVQAEGDQPEILLHSQICRGSDVVKAIAHGDKGDDDRTPYLWALAARDMVARQPESTDKPTM